MTASAKVFNTYELLEDILLHLPLIDLLHVWKVSQTFRDVVWDSYQINKALFISYATDKTVEYEEDEEDEYASWWIQPEDLWSPVIILNPFLELMLPSCERFPEEEPYSIYPWPQDRIRYDTGYNLFEYEDLPWHDSNRDWIPWAHPGVKWRKEWLDRIPDEHWITTMPLTDPPITKALIEKTSYFSNDESTSTGNLGFITSPGLDIIHLRDFVPPEDHGDGLTYSIGRSIEFRPVSNGYKTTGWEMLCLLETEGEQRLEMLREMELAAFPDAHTSWIYR